MRGKEYQLKIEIEKTKEQDGEREGVRADK